MSPGAAAEVESVATRAGGWPPAATDILVVGGGPAGLAVAIRARQRGLSVRVLDRGRPPIDKSCGEGLMPDGLARLEELEVALPAGEGFPFQGIRYLDEHIIAEARFPSGHGLGLRRIALHAAMVRRAEAAGADLWWETEAQGILPGAIASTAGLVRAQWIVAADGLRSTIRRVAGLKRRSAGVPRFGLTRHFAIEPWSDCVEVRWADRREAYVTPLGRSLLGVTMLWSGRGASFDALLGSFPELAARLVGARAVPPDRGAGPLSQGTGAVVQGTLALVGDAAGYLDAIAGEGLSVAFHEAFALVDAIAAGDLALYERACSRILRVPRLATRALLLAEQWPALRRRLVMALSDDPVLFRRLLAVHARQASAGAAAWTVPRLAWRLMRAGSW